MRIRVDLAHLNLRSILNYIKLLSEYLIHIISRLNMKSLFILVKTLNILKIWVSAIMMLTSHWWLELIISSIMRWLIKRTQVVILKILILELRLTMSDSHRTNRKLLVLILIVICLIFTLKIILMFNIILWLRILVKR